MVGRKVILTSRDVEMKKVYTTFEFWHSTKFGILLGTLQSDGEVKMYNLEDWNVRFEEW